MIVTWVVENGTNLTACVLELVMIILCIHSVFKTRFKFSIEIILLLVLDLGIMSLIYTEVLGELSVCIVYIMLFVYCIKLFKRKFRETVGRFLLGLLLAGFIEVAASIVSIPISFALEIEDSLMLLVNIIGLLVAIIILKSPQIRKRKNYFSIEKETWITLIALCGLSLLFIIIDYRIRGKVDQIYYFLFLISCVMVCFSTVTAQKARHELEKRRLELEMQEIYGSTYKELIAEVRRKQHDFKNQLGAIYSMHLTAKSLEDLIEKQRRYGNVLLEQCRYDKILVGCNNPILAGYLYYRCVAYEKSHVQVEYQIHVDGAECCLSLHEVIEVLGILLTNAFESYQAESKEKYIDLVVEESTDNLVLEVCNMADEITSIEIEKIFREGYSSKGKNRGLGLARVKQLASRVKGDLIVGNRLRENQNWVSFKVIIPKWEGELQ